MASHIAARPALRRLLSGRALSLAMVFGVVAYLLYPALPAYPDVPASAVPLRMVSSTGPLAEPNGKDFTHAFVRDGELHLVVRSYFVDPAPMSEPYLVVGPGGQGTVHIGVVPHFRFMGSKCEFQRQLEVAIPAQQWQQLSAVQVVNDSAYGAVTDWLAIGDHAQLDKLLRDSEQQAALRAYDGERRGCSA